MESILLDIDESGGAPCTEGGTGSFRMDLGLMADTELNAPASSTMYGLLTIRRVSGHGLEGS